MDNNYLDKELKRIFSEDISVPLKCRNALRNALYNKRKTTMRNRYKIATMLATISACFILTTGIVFALNYNKIVNYFRLGDGINTAVDNGYIESPNMEYKSSVVLEDVEIGVKIDDFLMDDANLSTHINFQFDKSIENVVNLKNLQDIELPDLIVTDEMNRILFCLDKISFDNYCNDNNLSYDFTEFNHNYMNSGLNHFINMRDTDSNIVSMTYNMYSEGYPKSKELHFKFSTIILKINDSNEANNTIILKGDWDINFNVPEKMYNRQTVSYKVINCSNSDFTVTTATLYDTGLEFGVIISSIQKPKEIKTLDNSESTSVTLINNLSEYNEWKKGLYDTSPIYAIPHNENWGETYDDTSYVENENGQKFETSKSPSRRQNSNFVGDDKFEFYETFTITKYNATDKLRVRLLYKGTPVIIELKKI